MQVRNSLLHFFRPSIQPPSGERYYRHRLLHKLSALKLLQFSRKGLDQLSIPSSLFLYMSLPDRDGFKGWFELDLGLFSLHKGRHSPPLLFQSDDLASWKLTAMPELPKMVPSDGYCDIILNLASGGLTPVLEEILVSYIPLHTALCMAQVRNRCNKGHFLVPRCC